MGAKADYKVEGFFVPPELFAGAVMDWSEPGEAGPDQTELDFPSGGTLSLRVGTASRTVVTSDDASFEAVQTTYWVELPDRDRPLDAFDVWTGVTDGRLAQLTLRHFAQTNGQPFKSALLSHEATPHHMLASMFWGVPLRPGDEGSVPQVTRFGHPSVEAGPIPERISWKVARAETTQCGVVVNVTFPKSLALRDEFQYEVHLSPGGALPTRVDHSNSEHHSSVHMLRFEQGAGDELRAWAGPYERHPLSRDAAADTYPGLDAMPVAIGFDEALQAARDSTEAEAWFAAQPNGELAGFSYKVANVTDSVAGISVPTGPRMAPQWAFTWSGDNTGLSVKVYRSSLTGELETDATSVDAQQVQTLEQMPSLRHLVEAVKTTWGKDPTYLSCNFASMICESQPWPPSTFFLTFGDGVMLSLEYGLFFQIQIQGYEADFGPPVPL